ncbi:hypothetical protein D5R81_04290 [Parashewanella spongiae]|uniref:KAP NTPase domain-containing protein n=1 Tax=Parashewanella spongiae TaxID=342950 RepID=A0A3A6UAN9_9GAMM|nr:P-loop NTPase fold protein [Parashewanella spongiae]MCL1077524.1 KAP family NTPase [Parashewanella spongiae]RJY18619.1 hypothetical protein D5R81_04290 [Parashewanella spongiae]
MEHYIEQFVTLLTDDSFPPMVLLDGVWGSGKTHFVREQLTPSLETKLFNDNQNRSAYLSVYGLSSINDFRDKILSLRYFKKEKTSWYSKLGANTIDAAFKNEGYKGSISSIVSGIAGVAKHKLFEHLSDFILIVDDLERLQDKKLVAQILGECFNLADRKNVKVIVIANSKHMEKGSYKDFEKVFSDQINFKLTDIEVVNIIKNQFEEIQVDVAQLMNALNNSKDVKNLRIIKRAFTRFHKLSAELSKVKDIDIKASQRFIFNQILLLCNASLSHGITKSEISSYDPSAFFGEKDSETEEGKKHLRIESSIESYPYQLTDNMIDFCYEGVYRFKDLKSELKLPETNNHSELDAFIMISPVKHEPQELKIAIIKLHNTIISSEKISLFKWMTFCDQYLYFIENGFINSEELSSKSVIIELSKNKAVESFDLTPDEERFYHHNFICKDLESIYDCLKNELKGLQKKSEIEKFTHSLVQSWVTVREQFRDKYHHKAILHTLTEKDIDSMLANWSASDFWDFGGYLKYRFEFNNIEEYFSDELSTLKVFLNKLTTYENQLKPCIKKGAVNQLLKSLIEVITKLEIRIETKIHN